MLIKKLLFGINSLDHTLPIFMMLSLILISFVSISYAVNDNVTIEGNLNPANRSEELYVVYVSPSNENRDIVFSIYGSGEVIFSKTSYIRSGSNYENFYVKFFPPLFQDNVTYVIEVKGPGLIGRENIVIKEEFRSYTSSQLSEEKRLSEEKLIDKIEPNLQSQTPIIQCHESTFLENGLCLPIPNFYAISACEKAGGNYDSSKLSCILPESPILVEPVDEFPVATLPNQNPQINEYVILIFAVSIPILIIYLIINKFRKNSKTESQTIIKPTSDSVRQPIDWTAENEKKDLEVERREQKRREREQRGKQRSEEERREEKRRERELRKKIKKGEKEREKEEKQREKEREKEEKRKTAEQRRIEIENRILEKEKEEEERKEEERKEKERKEKERKEEERKEKVRKEESRLLSYDELISNGWSIEQQESDFSLLSKDSPGLDKDLKFFESKNMLWEKSFSNVITISNITSSGLVSMVWEKNPKIEIHNAISNNTGSEIKSMLTVIDKFGKLKTNVTIMASPTAAVLHDTFFACIFPHPRNKLRCYSLIEKKWKLWNERVRKYGNSVLSVDDDVIVLSKQKGNSIILKANIDGVFERF